MISLLTMGQGNVKVLRKTLESVKPFCNEVIYGDVLLFPIDRTIVDSYKDEFNLKRVELPFNFIFKNGFASILNELADHATNDFVLYLNTSEVVDGDQFILDQLSGEYNAYPFDHETDTHTWYRLYNRKELRWSGFIHEALMGERRDCPFNLFRMKDLDKDMDDPFKARCFDFAKECVYFKNYMRIVDDPELLGATSPGWLDFATDNYQSFVERLEKKGDFYRAFETGDFDMLLNYIHRNTEFEKERLESSLLIEYQNSPMFLGKSK